MHFFYLDESGDTGLDLQNRDQPIMVLGGISLRDEGWNATCHDFEQLISKFFCGEFRDDFELHAYDLLSPAGGGHFAGIDFERRIQLGRDILTLLESRRHNTHFIALDKKLISGTVCESALPFDTSIPYLLGFDYMITWINWYVKERLGQSARGMVIVDEKEVHDRDVERILRNRRSDGPQAHRVKWIVEVGYPVDSRRNPMIQISDLAIFCVRRFLEIEHGHRENWSPEAKNFYACCYNRIAARMPRRTIVERGGRRLRALNDYLREVDCKPVGQWRRRYGL